MLRYLLSAYLSLALAAGPLLCCCTASGLTSFLSGSWANIACCTHTHAHSHGHEHGSKHVHQEEAGHNSPSSNHQEEKSPPSPTEKKCPCSQHDTCQVGAAKPLVTSAPSSLVVSPFDSAGKHFLPHAVHVGGAQAICFCLRRGQDDHVLWDGGDILRACSMLRC